MEATSLLGLEWTEAIVICWIFSEWIGAFDGTSIFASSLLWVAAALDLPRIVITAGVADTLELVTGGAFEAAAVGDTELGGDEGDVKQ